MRNLFAKIFGSITAKIVVILLAMAALTGTAVVTSHLVFTKVATDMTDMTAQKLPALQSSSDISDATSLLRNSLTEVLLAEDTTSLDAARDSLQANLTGLKGRIDQLGDVERASMAPLLEWVSQALDALDTARRSEFTNAEVIRNAELELNNVAYSVGNMLAEQADTSFFDAMIAGEAAMKSVGDGVTKLSKLDFGALQIVLKAEAELNMISGVAVALSSATDTTLVTTLNEQGKKSIARLERMPAKMRELGTTASLADPLEKNIKLLSEVLEGGRVRALVRRDEVLASVSALNRQLSTAEQAITMDLVMSSSATTSENKATVGRLLDEHVSQIRHTADLNTAVRAFYSSALEAALANDDSTLMMVQDRLSGASQTMERLASEDKDPEMINRLSGLRSFIDPKEGIVAKRRAQLQAQVTAADNARTAATQVNQIAQAAGQIATMQLSVIGSNSRDILGEITKSQSAMNIVSTISAAVFAVALLAVWWLIVRPLRAATNATSRLANGDLDVVEKLGRPSGEIGQLVSALRVFRDGIIEKQRLEAEEATARQEREAAAKRQAEEERAREQAEMARVAAQERAEHEREAAEAAERERLRAAADAERAAHQAAQSRVVTALADGLRALAVGDLRARITEAFPEGYEQLRLDFNEAVTGLNSAIRDISDSAMTIHAGSDNISSAAENLARRTEQTAATLEESAAALTELTASVGSAAQSADEADRVVLQARQSAEKSNSVVNDAVAAMGEIEQSSSKISKIIDVIDDIAFQTNLLALNAGVEAARAGEAGRGFAVVASEVRALAQRSSEAAREINGLITDSSRQVGRGVDLVHQVGQSLAVIVKSVTNISDNVSTIAASAREQSTGISEINLAVGQLDQTTQQNAAMVEETNAASQDLTKEAERLNQIINHFTIDLQAESVELGQSGRDAA
ncbi:methyl-accepting chemotaxis protein [Phaeovulum sp. W22_SRMD_FR3]|uniref:methyl-accepting chemotaxis protein n=1 Tax=Phaeovulum sp. W22_SRMD_FR3 TaxID=3240274 RepID=UPI003F9DF925